jgi:hypothetical protein
MRISKHPKDASSQPDERRFDTLQQSLKVKTKHKPSNKSKRRALHKPKTSNKRALVEQSLASNQATVQTKLLSQKPSSKSRRKPKPRGSAGQFGQKGLLQDQRG